MEVVPLVTEEQHAAGLVQAEFLHARVVRNGGNGLPEDEVEDGDCVEVNEVRDALRLDSFTVAHSYSVVDANAELVRAHVLCADGPEDIVHPVPGWSSVCVCVCVKHSATEGVG